MVARTTSWYTGMAMASISLQMRANSSSDVCTVADRPVLMRKLYSPDGEKLRIRFDIMLPESDTRPKCFCCEIHGVVSSAGSVMDFSSCATRTTGMVPHLFRVCPVSELRLTRCYGWECGGLTFVVGVCVLVVCLFGLSLFFFFCC